MVTITKIEDGYKIECVGSFSIQVPTLIEVNDFVFRYFMHATPYNPRESGSIYDDVVEFVKHKEKPWKN